MESADRDEWETSRLHRRLQRVLFLAIDSSKVAPLAQRRFGRAVVWQPCADEWQLLQHDWEDLMGAIGSGRGATSARERAKSSSFAPRPPMRPFERLYPGPRRSNVIAVGVLYACSHHSPDSLDRLNSSLVYVDADLKKHKLALQSFSRPTRAPGTCFCSGADPTSNEGGWKDGLAYHGYLRYEDGPVQL